MSEAWEKDFDKKFKSLDRFVSVSFGLKKKLKDFIRRLLAEQEQEKQEVLDCLYDMWWQFSCDSVKDGKKVKNDMGMSSLEWCKHILVEQEKIKLDKHGNHLLDDPSTR